MTKRILMCTAAATIALTFTGGALAQTTAPDPSQTPAEQAGADETEERGDIVVTGSRIAREGFDQPTPTTVIGEVELRLGARANVAQVLNDSPQFRASVNPAISVGNTSSGTAPVDLRGLGTARTLTLLNGRRFVGEGNLNLIPSALVERIEVVTGGASAAYGSNAVAGVVNILLDTEYNGLSLGASGGISERGDAGRYSLNGKFGAGFAGGNGRILVGVEYVNDRGIPDRNSRPQLGSTNFAPVTPGSTTDRRVILIQDVNYPNRSAAGVIIGGPLNGQTFNPDGTLRPFRGPNAQGVGGEDGIGLYDDVYGASPFERVNGFARISYDVGDATFFVEGSYGRAKSNYPFFPDLLLATQTINLNNPFVSPAIRDRVLGAGQTTFTVGRVFNDIFQNTFDLVRENREGAVGVDVDLGGSFKLNAFGSYGEVENNELVTDSRITANYNRAVDARFNGAGQIVCAVNADASTANDDPACAPLNILGSNVASPAALAYVRGNQSQRVLSKLTSFGVQLQGDLFDLPGGPLAVAVGVEGRKEEQTTVRDALTRQPGYFGFPLFAQDFGGEFSVKEGFVEAAAPLFDFEGTAKLDLNGAARYSDFSTSGGIWSWKVGGTLRLFDDLLLRATRSRDIRSPGIGNLFSARATTIGPLVDRDTVGRAGTPGYNPNPTQVFTFSGGNPDLDQERAQTLTFGASYSPSFFPGFQASVDYYKIKINGAITTLGGAALTSSCANGIQAACDRVIRDATGTVTTVFANAQNIAFFETSGLDFEASYVLQMSNLSSGIDGTLRIRALATYVDRFFNNDGSVGVDGRPGIDRAGELAGLPSWRGNLGFTYQGEDLGLDARVRYVEGGSYDRQNEVRTVNGITTGLVNSFVGSRTYLDVGAQIKATDRFTFFANVNNVFDRKPPLTTAATVFYDVTGRFYLAGARFNF